MNPEINFIQSQSKQWVLHLIFVRIPKNASTSIYHHLGKYNLVKKYEPYFKNNCNNPLYRNFFDTTHAKPEEIKKIIPANVNNYFSFCVVRNPWDRFVSMYSFSLKNKLWKLFGLDEEPSFLEFCKICEQRKEDGDPYFFPIQQQCEWLSGGFDVNKILTFENLKTEFAEMIQDINACHISPHLPHMNATDHKNYQHYYNDYTKDLVAELYNKDIEQFNYQF